MDIFLSFQSNENKTSLIFLDKYGVYLIRRNKNFQWIYRPTSELKRIESYCNVNHCLVDTAGYASVILVPPASANANVKLLHPIKILEYQLHHDKIFDISSSQMGKNKTIFELQQDSTFSYLKSNFVISSNKEKTCSRLN